MDVNRHESEELTTKVRRHQVIRIAPGIEADSFRYRNKIRINS